MNPQTSNTEHTNTTPKRVLVTGGAGFIGSHLTDLLLAQGHSVTIIDDLSTGKIENLPTHLPNLTLIKSKVTSALPSLQDSMPFDLIFHLAATVGVALVMDNPIAAIDNNVHQTAALLEHAANHGSPPTLITSSSEVYGKPNSDYFSEDDDTHYGPTTSPRWSYALGKALDEHLALAHHNAGSVPVTIARLFNTIGPRQVGTYGMVLPRFVAAAIDGQDLIIHGDGKQSRCFCDVRDVSQALISLLVAPKCLGQVFNIGSDSPITIEQLAQRVIQVTNSSSTTRTIEYSKAYPNGFEDLRHRRPNLKKISNAIGFSPNITLDQSIRDIATSLATDHNIRASLSRGASA